MDDVAIISEDAADVTAMKRRMSCKPELKCRYTLLKETHHSGCAAASQQCNNTRWSREPCIYLCSRESTCIRKGGIWSVQVRDLCGKQVRSTDCLLAQRLQGPSQTRMQVGQRTRRFHPSDMPGRLSLLLRQWLFASIPGQARQYRSRQLSE